MQTHPTELTGVAIQLEPMFCRIADGTNTDTSCNLIGHLALRIHHRHFQRIQLRMFGRPVTHIRQAEFGMSLPILHPYL